jgi:hypothetical protein
MRTGAGSLPIKLYGQLAQPEQGADEVHKAEVAAGRIVVACGQAAKLLKPTHQPLDPVALPVAKQVHCSSLSAAGLAGNKGLGPEGRHGGQHLIGIVCFVSQ